MVELIEHSPVRLAEARREFARLLQTPGVPEREWQLLFSTFPFILSSGLPLRLASSEIHPLARPGYSDPDFVFYPNIPTRYPHYGVIEIKRPQDRIIHIPRKDIVILSRSANTAMRQAESYLARLSDGVLRSSKALCFGGMAYAFIIIGLSEELELKIVTEVLSESYLKAIPRGFEILPYDVLFKRFDQSIPPKFIMLCPYFYEPRQITREEEAYVRTLLERNPGLLVDGVNTPDAAAELSRPGGGFETQQVPGDQDDRCVWFIEDYLWQSDSAPAGITTKIALDVLTFSKEDILKAIRLGFEGQSLKITGTRMWDCGIWEDASSDFDRKIIPDVTITLHVDLNKERIEVKHNSSVNPELWTPARIRTLSP
jgi:hypothetical protein